MEAVRRAQRVLAADRDQAVEVEGGHVLQHGLGAVIALEDVRPRGPENRPAPGEDAAGRLDAELLEVVFERSAPAVAEPDDRVPVDVDALTDDRANDRIKARTVAAPCQ